MRSIGAIFAVLSVGAMLVCCGDGSGSDPAATPTVTPSATPAATPVPVLCGDGQMPGFTCQDLSRFESFLFTRQRHTGFCPPSDAIFRVALRVEVGGVGFVTGTILNRPPSNAPGCRGQFGNPQCFDTSLAERQLTSAELTRVRSAFRSVELFLGRDPACDQSERPCLVNFFRWDARSAIDSPCAFLSISERDAQRLMVILDEIVRAGP